MVGSFMIHMMEVASMNSHEIGQVECGVGESWMVGQTRPIGCALEPTLVLLNHSCDPTMIRVNLGSSTICFASRDIRAGEEITTATASPSTPAQRRRGEVSWRRSTSSVAGVEPALNTGQYTCTWPSPSMISLLTSSS